MQSDAQGPALVHRHVRNVLFEIIVYIGGAAFALPACYPALFLRSYPVNQTGCHWLDEAGAAFALPACIPASVHLLVVCGFFRLHAMRGLLVADVPPFILLFCGPS